MTPDLSTNEPDGAYVEPAAATATDTHVDPPAAAATDTDPIPAAAASVSEGEAPAVDDDGNPIPPAYKANFKYKVHQEEREIPEKYRGLVKSEEDEKELRELFELAQGFKEHAKPKHEQLEQAFGHMQRDFTQTMNQVQEIRAAYQAGDLETFFQKMNVNKQKILQWAVNEFQYMELPPEQKAAIDAQRATQRAALNYQQQNSQLSSQLQSQIQQARSAVLNSELADPEIKPLVAAFDQRMGKPGAFVQEVYNRGQLAWIQSKGRTDLTPRQAIEQVVSLFGLKGATAGAGVPGAASVATGGKKGPQDTLPNTGSGRAASPVAKKFKSVDELKKHYKEKYVQ